MKTRLRDFVGVDCEGAEINGRHELILMCIGEKAFHRDGKHLQTRECLDFILAQTAFGLLVGFSFQYDVNMILRDLSQSELETLWNEGEVYFTGGYTIGFRPGKWFDVRRHGVNRRIYDVFGFFNQPFVKTLREWDVLTEAQLQELQKLKDARPMFHVKQLPEITFYCLSEVRYLESLMWKFRRTCDDLSITPRTWQGAGAIAGEKLRSIGFSKTLAWDEWPEPVKEACLSAYYGGRVELYRQGPLPECHMIDLNSAYPAQLVNLPTLAGGRWERIENVSRETMKEGVFRRSALYKTKWKCHNSSMSPFPSRVDGTDRIVYLDEGNGWYHGCEVEMAMALRELDFRGNTWDIDVLEGWSFIPASQSTPLDFVADWYKKRLELKQRDDLRNIALKLGMNAIYGKLAQGVGYRGKRPAYQNYYLAGRVTSGCRATILETMWGEYDRLVSVSTDGLLLTSAPEYARIDENGKLGEWSYAGFVGKCCIMQPGVLFTKQGNITKTRGFGLSSVTYQQAVEAWERDGSLGRIDFEERRFVGLGRCMIDGRWDDRRQWVTDKRSVSYTNSQERQPISDDETMLGFGVAYDETKPFQPLRANQTGDVGARKHRVTEAEQPV